eukprot:12141674-Alexandrium_andersonii.AAC.1
MVHARGRAGTSAPGECAWLARQGVCSAGVARAHQELCARRRAHAQKMRPSAGMSAGALRASMRESSRYVTLCCMGPLPRADTDAAR